MFVKKVFQLAKPFLANLHSTSSLYVILLRIFVGIALFIIMGEANSTLGAGLDSNHRVHIFLEYHSVCPLVQIGTPLSRKRVCPT
jgi:hypothetical protein